MKGTLSSLEDGQDTKGAIPSTKHPRFQSQESFTKDDPAQILRKGSAPTVKVTQAALTIQELVFSPLANTPMGGTGEEQSWPATNSYYLTAKQELQDSVVFCPQAQ